MKIQTYHVQQLARFLDKLKTTPDGDGSLLDHSMILYGSNMSNSNVHNHFPLPTLVAGGGAGRVCCSARGDRKEENSNFVNGREIPKPANCSRNSRRERLMGRNFLSSTGRILNDLGARNDHAKVLRVTGMVTPERP